MKKICSLLLILHFCLIPVFAVEDLSENGFEILIDETPEDIVKKDKKGLSDGAITAIALGSTFGGLLVAGGVLRKFLNNNKLVCTRVLGGDKGYLPICYNDELLDRIQGDNYKLLYRAIKEQNLKDDCSVRYIFVQDSELQENSYHRIYLDLSTKSKIKIIQYSNTNNIESFLFNGDNEINLSKELNDIQNNIQIKSGNFIPNIKNRTFIDTIYKGTNNAQYALIIAIEEY